VPPGGVADADQLRTDDAVVAFVRTMFERGRPVTVICHAPWLLVEGSLVQDRTLTSWPSLRTDLVNAGANRVDDEVQICRTGPNVLVTSRKPEDLDAVDDVPSEAFGAARDDDAA
jgi:protease I